MEGDEQLIPAHGGYRKLLSYQNATIVYDLTVMFCAKYISKFSRTKDQMEQAARSGKQNIAEGSMASGTSKKTELTLVGVARSSQEELLADYEDFLRQRRLAQWGKEDARVKAIRQLSYKTDRTYLTYESYMTEPESAANALVCLIHQTNYLLDQQIRALEKKLIDEGGISERLYQIRRKRRGY